MRGKTADVGSEDDDWNTDREGDDMEDVQFFEEEFDDEMAPEDFGPDPMEAAGPNTREQFEDGVGRDEDEFLFEE